MTHKNNFYLKDYYDERLTLHQKLEDTLQSLGKVFFLTVLSAIIICVFVALARAQELPVPARIMTASWYSVRSLHQDGQWKITKGRCADGSIFSDNALTCATRAFPLHSTLRITALDSGKSVVVRATDRIGKRFAQKRIDLSRATMVALGGKQALIQGLIKVKVERIK